MHYDVSSICLKGRCGPLAQHDYSCEHRDDRPQLVIALLYAADGCSVAVEVFAGNTADPATLMRQIETLWQRFIGARSFGGSQAKADRLHTRSSTITTWPKSPVSEADAARARLDGIFVRCASLSSCQRGSPKTVIVRFAISPCGNLTMLVVLKPPLFTKKLSS